jgi:PAS domain S-box-containing protein
MKPDAPAPDPATSVARELAALRESEEKYRRLAELSPVAMWINEGGLISYANPAALRLLGASRIDQVVGRRALDFVHPDFHPLVRRRIAQIEGGQSVPLLEEKYVRLDGSPVDVEVVATPFDTPRGQAVQVQFQEITERKRTELALREKTEELDRYFNSALDLLCIADTEGRFRRLNPQWQHALGYTMDELRDRRFLDFVHPEDLASTLQALARLAEQEEVLNFVNRYRCKDGSYRWVEWRSFPAGKLIYAAARDITERRRTEEALRGGERRLAEALRVARMGHWEYDIRSGLFTFNDQYYSLHHTTAAEVGGYQMTAEEFARRFVHPADASAVGQAIGRAVAAETVDFEFQIEARGLCVDGAVRWLAVWFRIEKDDAGQTVRLLGVNQDITERRQAEDALRRANRQLRMLSDCNQELMRSGDERELLAAVCRIAVQVGGYQMAWVGYAEDDAARSVRPIAHAGVEEGYLRLLRVTWADDERGHGPIGTAIRSGQPCPIQDIQGDPRFLPWRAEAAARGYAAACGLPLIMGGKTFGALGIYSSSADAFDSDEVGLLNELASDLAFGIAALRTQRERNGAADALRHREALERLITAISSQFVNLESDEVDGAINGALRAIGEFTDADRSYLFFFSDGGRADNTHEWCREGIEPQRHRLQGVSVDEFASVAEPLWRSEVVHIPRVADLGEAAGAARAEFEREGIRSLVAVPIEFRKTVVGFLGLDAVRVEKTWTADVTALLRVVGEVCASALERKRAEAERRQALADHARLQDQLQQAMKMEAVGRLAGGVAHDFNNLLMAIFGNVDLARLGLLAGDPRRRHIDEIAKAAERAASLTRQLLAFSRRQIIEPRALNLNELVANVQKMLSRLIGEDIELETALDKGLATVKVDAGQFEQVLANLAVNARDAMPRGGRLLIQTSNAELDQGQCLPHPQLRPGRFVRLAVSDTGVGMSDDVKRRIFEPFFTTKPMGRGTGLGLATIFGAVKQAGGAIEVDSEIGRGTRFSVYLPAIDGPAEPLTLEPLTTDLPGGRETILLVEDDEGVRLSTRETLGRLGYSVLAAADGEQALDLAATPGQRIDLLFTDVVMPGLNGRELAERLLALQPDIKVMFTSGYAEEVTLRHGVVDEELAFIAKPYSVQALARKLRDVLGRRA